MEELVEQYKSVKKWRREMFIAAACILVLAVIIIVVGIIFSDMMALLFIFAGVMGILAAALYLIARITFKKADSLVKEYLAGLGKSEDEIRSILGETKK